MRTVRASGLLAGLCLAFAVGHASADAIQWQTSLAAAMTKAKAGNKLIMADFYTDW